MPSGPTRNRSEEDKEAVRRSMMEAAAELLVAEGYAGFTLARVARRVGFTTTNVYRYFRSKDDLLYAAVEDAFRRFGERLEQAARSTEHPRERIQALGRAYVEFGLAHPVHYELMFVLRTDYLFVERPVPGVDKLAYLTEALAVAMHAGAIPERDMEGLADALWGVLHGVVSLALAMPFFDEARTRRALAEAFWLIERALGPL